MSRKMFVVAASVAALFSGAAWSHSGVAESLSAEAAEELPYPNPFARDTRGSEPISKPVSPAAGYEPGPMVSGQQSGEPQNIGGMYSDAGGNIGFISRDRDMDIGGAADSGGGHWVAQVPRSAGLSD